MTDWLPLLLEQNRRALAKCLTIVENDQPQAQKLLSDLYPHTGKAWVIGITGAPGTGKSSLVNALTQHLRAQAKTVGIIAVDPTSPFTGGAILGDRIRMRDLSGDPGVFIRSMASRGSLGGLSRTTADAVRVMDAFGFDYIIIETVGAGQSEVDVVRSCHTTIVVEAPGLGDDIQAIKAGILEIADILVVNKADRPGARQTVRALKAMLELGHPAHRSHFVSHHGKMMDVQLSTNTPDHDTLWIPPVLQTVATDQTGFEALFESIEAHKQFLQQSGSIHDLEKRYLELEIYERLQSALMKRLLNKFSASDISGMIDAILSRNSDPYLAVEQLINQLGI